MRLVDDKGRLFGKINIIDLLIIILIFYIATVFFFKQSNLRKLEHYSQRSDIDKAVTSVIIDSQGQSSTGASSGSSTGASSGSSTEAMAQFNEVSLIIKFPGYPEGVVKAIAVGDKKEDDPDVEIKEIISIRPAYIITVSGVIDHPELKSVVVKMSLMTSREGNRMYYNDIPLKVGGQFLLKTDKYDINGEILEITE